MFYYVPLEPYPERYTMQLSAEKTGWYEYNWYVNDINFRRIEPITDHRHNIPSRRITEHAFYGNITTGSVVDAISRPLYTFRQVEHLLVLLDRGLITNDDVIFFDDFWTPGFEALPYAFHLKGVKPKMYAYCWAQSVDEFDFTHSMQKWIRPFERGISNCLDGIFVANTLLAEKLRRGLGISGDKIHVVGLPFDSREVMARMPTKYQLERFGKDRMSERDNQVVFSSRWDVEKNPDFFLKVATKMLESEEIGARLGSLSFVVCTSAPKIRSNKPDLLIGLEMMLGKYPDNFFLKENLSKEEYYKILTESKVQFNCADQDWVSFTLLEASVAGCYPVYPYFRSFPETFNHRLQFLYKHKDLNAAVDLITAGLVTDEFDRDSIIKRSWIHSRFDDTWKRMAVVMGIGADSTIEASIAPLYEDE
jgi:glycosyltransferase involved in cell wall biosynthesis